MNGARLKAVEANMASNEGGHVRFLDVWLKRVSTSSLLNRDIIHAE
jgi:hypothetical protein